MKSNICDMHAIMIKRILCFIALPLLALPGIAQNMHDVIPAAGGHASGSGGSVCYSVGQVVYKTNTGTNGSIAQGIQQPYEIFVIDAIEADQNIDLSISVYPNPTADVLTISTTESNLSDLLVQLFDDNGNRLMSEIFSSNQVTIDMNCFVSATYFIKIVRNNQTVKTFKIIKTK